MPFIGKDWRSPGEQWVKTEQGSWERLKILYLSSHQLYQKNGLTSSGESSSDSDSENECNLSVDDAAVIDASSTKLFTDEHENDKSNGSTKTVEKTMQTQPPHIQITLKSTREVAGYNRISEAFQKLDFCNAINDVRRFNYICKLLHLLITQNLTSLSGCATRLLFTLLERVAWQVASNQQNIHILHTLLHDLKKIMKKYYCWGRPLGSTLVWHEHLRTIEKICEMANTIEIKRPAEGQKKLTDLPEELIREILFRLTDYRDLINSGKACSVMGKLLEEQTVWKQLCKYHFTKTQIKQAPCFSREDGSTDWEKVFHSLRKKFGLREEYPDSLFLCRHCRCLFWKSLGHPCFINERLLSNSVKVNEVNDTNEDMNMVREQLMVPTLIPVSPEAFLKFFSL